MPSIFEGVDWTDMTEQEQVAKAIRDTMWKATRPCPSQAYIDSLPLTPMNLAAADAAIEALDRARGVLQ
jgi:hypothetical protein